MKKMNFVLLVALSVLFSSCDNPLFNKVAGIYEVEFETNGGSSVDSVKTNRIDSIPQTKKENCDFEGWYSSSAFSGNALTFPYNVQDDVTLYAKWLQKYNVSFDTDGGNPETIPAKTVTIVTQVVTPAKNGYTFLGWYDGDAKVTFPYTLKSDTNLVAKWQKNYTVTFESNGGETLPNQTTGILSELPTVTKTNYEFAGWYEVPSLTGEKVSEPFTVTKDTTLYAKWLPTYLVTFETNGGSEIPSYRARKIDALASSEKQGFSFVGWWTDGSFTKKANVPCEISTDITFYAKFEKNYTVTFNTNGGGAVQEIATYKIENAPITTLANKSFDGWWTSEDFAEGTKVAFPYTVENDVTLYAKWVAERWTVTYSANGGTGTAPEAQQVEKGKSISLATNSALSKPGFAFNGWNTKADGKGSSYTVGQNFAPSGNIMLYALWGKDYGEMVTVQAGTFKFGDPDEDASKRATITLTKDYKISKYEVTYELWSEVATWARKNGYTITNAQKGYATNDQYKQFVPATNISWNMACVWLNAYSEYKDLDPVYKNGSSVWRDDTSANSRLVWDKSANGFRLPTECEWEFAAKGGKLVADDARTTYSGSNNINEVAWYNGNSGSECHPVGTKKANQLGIFDMSGSVEEWCWDGYADFGTGELTDPVHNASWSSGHFSYVIYRGGALNDNNTDCTNYYRFYCSYSYDAYSSRGIRIAQNAE